MLVMAVVGAGVLALVVWALWSEPPPELPPLFARSRRRARERADRDGDGDGGDHQSDGDRGDRDGDEWQGGGTLPDAGMGTEHAGGRGVGEEAGVRDDGAAPGDAGATARGAADGDARHADGP